MNCKQIMVALAIALPLAGFAQLSTPPDNWQHLDKMSDGYMGVSADKAYEQLLKGKKSQTVIVAVIDSGVDPLHQDLKDVMWHNPGEIPNNKTDDDGNGYTDDVYGWNFIGGKDGKNVHHDQLEITRIVAAYKKRFGSSDGSGLSGKDKKDFERYKELEKIVTIEQQEAASSFKLYSGILESVNALIKAMGKEDITAEDLKKFKTDDPKLSRASAMLSSMLAEGGTAGDIRGQLQDYVDQLDGQANYNYDVNMDARSVVGDNYLDSYERNYGNNNVKGPDASHGTHVAGIIAASRGNGEGMDGIADNVKIMAIRCVPNGDERDKDVANAIIYAVDNGASVINMSFGKGYSWDKKAVDKAVKYAKKHDVLFIHAAGNSGQDNDNIDNFPNDKFEKGGLFAPKTAKNWIEVGALSWQGGADAPANFSNYGKANVDLFAPGMAIYSTIPDGGYKHNDGTSMASPVVAGVAAMIRSYYPDLTADQVKDVLLSSTVMTKDNLVKKPGGSDEDLVPFSELCVTGGAVNSFEAVKKAEKVKGKKKQNKTGAGKSGAAGNAKKGRA